MYRRIIVILSLVLYALSRCSHPMTGETTSVKSQDSTHLWLYYCRYNPQYLMVEDGEYPYQDFLDFACNKTLKKGKIDPVSLHLDNHISYPSICTLTDSLALYGEARPLNEEVNYAMVVLEDKERKDTLLLSFYGSPYYVSILRHNLRKSVEGKELYDLIMSVLFDEDSIFQDNNSSYNHDESWHYRDYH